MLGKGMHMGGKGNGTRAVGLGLRGALMTGTALLLFVQPAAGQVVEWLGNVNGSWTTSGNWSGGAEPTSTDNVLINSMVGGISPVTLDGAPGEAGDLTIGDDDLAGLFITNDGVLTTNGVVTLGNGSASHGVVIINGEDSEWNSFGEVLIGDSGSGVLHIVNGGALTNSGEVAIGWGVDATGSVVVSGTGSIWANTGTILIGIDGQGDLRIEDGGYVQSSTVAVGTESNLHESTVLVDDATWAVSELITGSARFEVRNGAVVTNSGTGATLGTQNGMHTDLIVDGGEWETNGPMTIGRDGSALISVLNGGTLTTGVAAGSTTLGSRETGRGEIVVSGSGSTWTANGALRVGESGQGILTIEDRAEATAKDSVSLGQDETGMGHVHVRDGAEWHIEQELSVGANGEGEFAITGGGTVHVGDYLVIADNDTAIGAVVIDGIDSLLNVNETIDVGATGKGSLTISNGGEVSVGAGEDIQIAANAGGEGVLNIGAAAGEIAQGAGILTADRVIFHNGNGTLVFNHTGTQADGYTFDTALESTGAGSHAIGHMAGVTNYTGDGSGFTGTTTISGGILYVQNKLGGSIVIGGSGTLRGVGGLGGDVTVGAGGTIAPGNSIGTLSVAAITFAPGSIYQVELNDGGNTAGTHNDLIKADTATIEDGAIFHVVPENGTDDGSTYAPNTQYTIIETAAAGNLTVNGAPDITDDFAFLSFTGHHDGQNYYLTSSQAAASFCLPGASFNQCQTGEAVRDLGPGNLAYDAVVGMSETNANAAFNALSGEVHASGQHIIDQTFGLFSRTLHDQASAGIGDGLTGGQVFTAPLAYGPSTPAGPGVAAINDATTSAYADQRVHNAWLAPLGGRGTVDADGNAAALDWWAAGLAGGYEGALDVASGNAYAGFGVGYIRSHGSVDARLSRFESDGFHIGAYGGWQDGPWTLAGSLAYAANLISTERNIVLGAIKQTANASYWNHTVGFSGEAAYDFNMGGGTTLSPLATLDAGWSGHGGFTETGAGALNLTGASESWSRLDTGLGIGLQHVVLTESGRVTLDGRAVWEHAFADVVPNHSLAFAGGPTGFTVSGPDAGRDRLHLGAGVSFEATEELTVRASYSGLFSGNQQNHTVYLGLSVTF